MNKVDLVKRAWNLDNPKSERASYLSDDFRWTDSAGSPAMDKDSWLAMGQLMESAFPDLAYVMEDIRQEGDGVVVIGHFEGTFSNDFDLSAMGMGVIPATGAAVGFPTSTAQLSFDGDKISKVHALGNGPDAGMAGFLKALGADKG